MRRGFLLTSLNAKNDDSSSEAAPPPKKRMTLDAPVPLVQQKQPEPVNKEPINVLAQMQDVAMDWFQKHGNDTNNFVVTNELAGKMKELCEKTSAVKAFMPDGVNVQPIRKRIQLTIKNAQEVFTKDVCVHSTPIELLGFKWSLAAATTGNTFRFPGLFLFAKPPNGFNENFRIEVDCRFTILNAVTSKDLIKEKSETYTMDEKTFIACGCPFMATLGDLLDPSNRFLTPEGNIEALADFTIKSATLDHHLI